jgi:hypothetical protein
MLLLFCYSFRCAAKIKAQRSPPPTPYTPAPDSGPLAAPLSIPAHSCSLSTHTHTHTLETVHLFAPKSVRVYSPHTRTLFFITKHSDQSQDNNRGLCSNVISHIRYSESSTFRTEFTMAWGHSSVASFTLEYSPSSVFLDLEGGQ